MSDLTIPKLVEALDNIDPVQLSGVAEHILKAGTWRQTLYEYFQRLDDDAFAQAASAIHVADVQPFNVLIHKGRGYNIVFNYFDADEITRCLRLGRHTPHNHHFAFATSIVAGEYHHWKYDRSSDGYLTLADREICSVGHTYTMHPEQHHFVPTARDGTASLQVQFDIEQPPARDTTIGPEVIARLHRNVLQSLGTLSE